MSSITNFEPFRHQSNPCFGKGIESIFELPLNICSNLSTFAFYIGPHLTARNRTLRIFLKATSLQSKVASQPTILVGLGWRVERLGQESGVWGG
ncbi:hypothetical protein CY35_07G111200 [Sphagnum magellanicum]|uniref:Uncharacterized protein n=1 Tax=Sphagnum magellanicum TaxID=128215 RepID=A0ACB8HP37_9BRYO|nr:hypothetical protein CY35_07G111200 [Sphagnum magellanicum]